MAAARLHIAVYSKMKIAVTKVYLVRTLSNIDGGAFFTKIVVNYFQKKKAPSWMFQRTLNAPRYILLHALHKILEIKTLLKYEAINIRILPWDKLHANF